MNEINEMAETMEMKKLSREEAIQEFRKMWNWIADETKKQRRILTKNDYFVTHDISERIYNECCLCEYVCSNFGLDDEDDDVNCKYCPVDWNSRCPKFMCIDKKYNGDNEGLYLKWWDCNSNDEWQESAKLARQIANLPERKEEK